MSTLIVKEFINYKDFTLGMDQPPKDGNPVDYLKQRVYYNYNSKGFRDDEWPNDLSDAVWCIGDSFTSGVAQPQNETWPAKLKLEHGVKIINLGEDGCSNDTICLRALEVFEKYKPKNIVIMWSYLHRRRINGKNVHHSKESFGLEKDIENFHKNYNAANNLPTNIINLIVPTSESKHLKLEKILDYQILDYARDDYHFGTKTCSNIANQLQMHILTKSSK